MALRELLAEFQIDPTQAVAALGNIGARVDHLAGTLGNLVSAFVGSAMVSGIKSFIDQNIAAAKEVRITADKLGVSTDALQEFQFAAGTAGIEAEGAATGLKFLNKNIGLAITGNAEAAQSFSKLGIHLKNADGSVRELGDVLPEVADAFGKMDSQQERTAVSMQLFGRQGADLLPLLKQGGKGLDELRKKFYDLGGGMSKDFIERSKDAGRAMGATKFGLTAVKRAIVFEALPAVTSFARGAQEWTARLLRLNRETDLAKDTMIVFGAASAVATLKSAAGFAKLLGIVPKDAGFWKMALGLGEFALVIAGIAIVALAFEDLFGFLTGKDSVIGEIIDSLYGVGAQAAAIQQIRTEFAGFAQEMAAFQPLIEMFNAGFAIVWKETLPLLAAGAKEWFGQLAQTLTLLARLSRWVIGELGDLVKVYGEIAGGAGNILKFFGDEETGDKLRGVGKNLQTAGAGITQASTSVPRAGASNGFTAGEVNANSNNKIEINVQGGNTNSETGRAVADGVRNAFGQGDVNDLLSTAQWGK